MIKSKRSNLIMVLSVMVLLTSLLLSIVNITGAWLTDSSGTNKTVNAYIKTSEANLNVYQENSTGTQTRIEKSLPTGYTQLEYIESTGTQYLNIGYYANGNTSVDMEFEMTSVSKTSTLYCSRTDLKSNTFTAFVFNQKIRWDYNESQIATNISISAGVRYNLQTKAGEIVLNGTTYSTGVSKESFNATAPMTLFASSGEKNSIDNMSLMKIYKFKIYENENLIKSLIPAKNSSGTLGLYDLVEGKFYTNAGTGTFVAGSESLTNTTVSLAYDSSNLTNNKITYGSAVNLKLLLKNEDLGQSFGVRYKVEFYSATASGKAKLNSTISGMTTPTSSSNGFIYNSTDGYYYYQNNSGANVVFEPKTISTSTSKYLMKSFTIAESSSANLFGGNSIYMEISVESINI